MMMRAPLVERSVKMFLIFNNGLSRDETSKIGFRTTGDRMNGAK